MLICKWVVSYAYERSVDTYLAEYGSITEHLRASYVCVMQFYESVGVYHMSFSCIQLWVWIRWVKTLYNFPTHLIVHDLYDWFTKYLICMD
jgi:hypothetical protein